QAPEAPSPPKRQHDPYDINGTVDLEVVSAKKVLPFAGETKQPARRLIRFDPQTGKALAEPRWETLPADPPPEPKKCPACAKSPRIAACASPDRMSCLGRQTEGALSRSCGGTESRPSASRFGSRSRSSARRRGARLTSGRSWALSRRSRSGTSSGRSSF